MTDHPEKRLLNPYVSARPTEVWLVDDIEVWKIWCTDCGYRVGTVNAGNEYGAIRLHEDHRKTIHA